MKIRLSELRMAIRRVIISEGLEDNTDNWEQEQEDFETYLTEKYGRHVGLNADWNSTTWHLGPSNRPNMVNGDYYIVDDEMDGTYSVLRRFSFGYDDAENYDFSSELDQEEIGYLDDGNDYIQETDASQMMPDELMKYLETNENVWR